MDEKAFKDRNARDAIAVMTAWADHGSDDTFAKEVVKSIIVERDSLQDGFRDLAWGLIGLCGLLMTLREKEQGATYSETLTLLGSHYAGE